MNRGSQPPGWFSQISAGTTRFLKWLWFDGDPDHFEGWFFGWLFHPDDIGWKLGAIIGTLVGLVAFPTMYLSGNGPGDRSLLGLTVAILGGPVAGFGIGAFAGLFLRPVLRALLLFLLFAASGFVILVFIGVLESVRF